MSDRGEPYSIALHERDYRRVNNAVIRVYGDDLAVLADSSPRTAYEALDEQYLRVIYGLGKNAYRGISVDATLDGDEAQRELVKTSVGGNVLPKIIEDETRDVIVSVIKRRRLGQIIRNIQPQEVVALAFTVPPS